MIDINHQQVQDVIEKAATLLHPIYQSPNWTGIKPGGKEGLAQLIRQVMKETIEVARNAGSGSQHGVFVSSGGIKVIHWNWVDERPELEVVFDGAGSVFVQDLPKSASAIESLAEAA